MAYITDSIVFALLGDLINAGFAASGVPAIAGVTAQQDFQTSEANTPETPTIFMHKIAGPVRGFPKRERVFNVANQIFDTITTYWFQPAFSRAAQKAQGNMV